MARKSSSTAVQEELYPLPRDASEREAPEREPFDDARLGDLEAEQESPFLRGQKRVSVRRGSLPKKTANRLLWVGVALVALAILAAFGLSLYRYGKHSWRFRVDSSDQIEVAGLLGARPWRIVRKIILPAALPALIAGGSLCLLLTVNEFGIVLFIGAKGVITLPLLIYDKAIQESDYQAACVIAMINVVVSLGLFSLYRIAARRLGG